MKKDKQQEKCTMKKVIQTLNAYFKLNYDKLSPTAQMNADKQYIENFEHFKSNGIKYIPPHINISQLHFSVWKKELENKVIMGLGCIYGGGKYYIYNMRKPKKEVLELFIRALIQERSTNGMYQSIEELFERNEELIAKTDEHDVLWIFMVFNDMGALDDLPFRNCLPTRNGLPSRNNLSYHNKRSHSERHDRLLYFYEKLHLRLKKQTPSYQTDMSKRIVGVSYCDPEKTSISATCDRSELERYISSLATVSALRLQNTEEYSSQIMGGQIKDAWLLPNEYRTDNVGVKIDDGSGYFMAIIDNHIKKEYANLLNIGSCVMMKGKIRCKEHQKVMDVEMVRSLEDFS